MINHDVKSEDKEIGRTSTETPESDVGQLDDLSSLSSSGPLNSSARVAILAALLAFKRTTFTELELALHLPKSSLNLSLEILKKNKFVTTKRTLVQIGGPRTIIEITLEGEKAIKNHLSMMQDIARKLLSG